MTHDQENSEDKFPAGQNAVEAVTEWHSAPPWTTVGAALRRVSASAGRGRSLDRDRQICRASRASADMPHRLGLLCSKPQQKKENILWGRDFVFGTIIFSPAQPCICGTGQIVCCTIKTETHTRRLDLFYSSIYKDLFPKSKFTGFLF